MISSGLYSILTTGDGKADIIIVGVTGNMTALRNHGPADTQPLGSLCTELGQISPPVGDAAGIMFADVTEVMEAPTDDSLYKDQGKLLQLPIL